METNELDKEFIEFYQTIGRLQGIDTPLSTIVAVLYLEPKEISMEDLAKKTGYSLASISNKIKMLEPIGFVKRIRKPGTKKVFLYMDKNFLNIWKKSLIMKQESVINLAKEKIPEIIKKHKGKKLSEEQKNKLKLLENYYNQMKKFEIVVQEMLKKLNELNKK